MNRKPHRPAGLLWAMAPLFMVAALIAATSAFAGKPNKTTTYSGSATLTVVGDEPNASGVANLHATLSYSSGGWTGVLGKLRASCAGLTPGTDYIVMVDYFQFPDVVADAKGNFAISGDFGGAVLPYIISVYRVEPTGNVVVLSGVIAWH